MEWGLMEQVDSQQKRGGNPERLFALTERGTDFIEEYLVDTDEAPDAYAVKIDRALDETEQLRGRINDLERTVERQADEIEQLREERDAALDELRGDLEDALNGEYRALLKKEIINELDRDRELD